MSWFDWCIGLGAAVLCGSVLASLITEWDGVVLLLVASSVLVNASAVIAVVSETKKIRQMEASP